MRLEDGTSVAYLPLRASGIVSMNRVHHWICGSGWWKKFLALDLIPWALEGAAWKGRVLEIGPGPGLTTALIAPQSASLTCLEMDKRLAASLGAKTGGGNVRVLRGDATEMPLGSESFDSVLAFTMLHHVTPASAQCFAPLTCLEPPADGDQPDRCLLFSDCQSDSDCGNPAAPLCVLGNCVAPCGGALPACDPRFPCDGGVCLSTT